MKFVVVTEIDGKEVTDIVESDSPVDAINTTAWNGMMDGLYKGKDVATIGVYGISEYNLLESIIEKSESGVRLNQKFHEIDILKERLSKYE